MEHIPSYDLAKQIFSTSTEASDSVFDLTLLRIESRKPNFKNYLREILNEVYNSKQRSLQDRLKLVIAIGN
jgi:hypothetical protein